MNPPARSTGVPLDTQIWAQFGEALNPGTVTPRTVFLLVDTRRIRSSIGWDAGARRIEIIPQEAFLRGETYTVELSPELAAADGTRLGTTYYWQFTAIGVRPLETPSPRSGNTDESPFAPLSWDSTERSAGDVRYELYVGTDSIAVALRREPPLARSRNPYFIPWDEPWRHGNVYFWSVTVRNESTADRLDGPMWKFETVAAGAPIDSVELRASQWGYYDPRFNLSICLEVLRCGPGYNAAIHWNLPAISPSIRLAGASIFLVSPSILRPASVYASDQAWSGMPCDIAYPGPPYRQAPLADLSVGSLEVRGGGSALATHLQAALRGLPAFGYVLQGSTDRPVSTPAVYGAPPALMLYYYK